MYFGTSETFDVYFNEKLVEQVHQYKYPGVIVRSVNRLIQDPLYSNHRLISGKSRKAAFGMKKNLKCMQNLPPSACIMFDILVLPILTNGSDV